MQKRLFSFEPMVWEGQPASPNPQNLGLCGGKELNLDRPVSGVVVGSFWCERFVVVNTELLGGARHGVLGVQRVSVAPCAPGEAVEVLWNCP